MTEVVLPAVAATGQRIRIADRVFRGALLFNTALTAYWLFLLGTGGSSAFFKDYHAGLGQLGAVLGFFLFFHVAWGFVWLGVKTLVLKYLVGFSKEDRRRAYSSRLDGRFDVADYTARYSERRIRIADMIGRRGSFFLMGLSGFFALYANIASAPGAQFATGFLTDNLFDAVVVSWLFLAFYYVDGFLAAAIYGPQSRVMDGVLARANCLLISTLWGAFKFLMVPLGTRLAAIYPPREFRTS
jgi:hypothetical protein